MSFFIVSLFFLIFKCGVLILLFVVRVCMRCVMMCMIVFMRSASMARKLSAFNVVLLSLLIGVLGFLDKYVVLYLFVRSVLNVGVVVLRIWGIFNVVVFLNLNVFAIFLICFNIFFLCVLWM